MRWEGCCTHPRFLKLHVPILWFQMSHGWSRRQCTVHQQTSCECDEGTKRVAKNFMSHLLKLVFWHDFHNRQQNIHLILNWQPLLTDPTVLQTGVAWHLIKERTQWPRKSYGTRACSSTHLPTLAKDYMSLLHHAHPLWNTKACDIRHLAQRPSKFTCALKNVKSRMMLVWQVAHHVGRSAWWIETLGVKHPQLQTKLDWILALHLASLRSQCQNMTKHFLHSSPQLLVASTPCSSCWQLCSNWDSPPPFVTATIVSMAVIIVVRF